MSVMSDGIIEIQKKILLQEQMEQHMGANTNNNISSVNTTTNRMNHTTITTTTSSNTHPDPDDYDEVPVESNQNSLWNFDN